MLLYHSLKPHGTCTTKHRIQLRTGSPHIYTRQTNRLDAIDLAQKGPSLSLPCVQGVTFVFSYQLAPPKDVVGGRLD